jgi:hypothetical protein
MMPHELHELTRIRMMVHRLHRFSQILCLVLVLISPKAFKNMPVGRFFRLEFVILGLWFVCNLYFVFCNFNASQYFLVTACRGVSSVAKFIQLQQAKVASGIWNWRLFEL